jgi:steroid delta-isomerase
MSAYFRAYVGYLENLNAKNLNQISLYVAPNVHFKDPFNDVFGIEEMKAVFAHMFKEIGSVSFQVNQSFSDGANGCIQWTFTGQLRKKPWVFDGTSILSLNDVGLIVEHVDYWDAAGSFYEQLPIIGSILAQIRQRLAVRF